MQVCVLKVVTGLRAFKITLMADLSSFKASSITTCRVWAAQRIPVKKNLFIVIETTNLQQLLLLVLKTKDI